MATRAEINGVPAVVNLLGMVMADSEGRLLSLAGMKEILSIMAWGGSYKQTLPDQALHSNPWRIYRGRRGADHQYKKIKNTSRVNELQRYVWHGTSAKRMEPIVSGGFGLEDARLAWASMLLWIEVKCLVHTMLLYASLHLMSLTP